MQTYDSLSTILRADPWGQSYEEQGVVLRFTNSGDLQESAQVWVSAASIGTDDPTSGSIQATAFLRHPDGRTTEVAVEHQDGGSRVHFFLVRKPVGTVAPGVYRLLVQLPSETGGDSYQFDFEPADHAARAAVWHGRGTPHDRGPERELGHAR